MFTLKPYQTETLEKLTVFLKRAATSRDVKNAYAECTKENFGAEGMYNDAGFPSVPYVCLRLPTGGGKTILAAHTISLVCKEYLARDVSLVLWLVPSNTILEQTLKALRDVRHPYRLAINEAFSGNVSILTIEDALYLTSSTLKGNLTIIVSTLAAWRQKSTEGRKVYQDNGALKEHFDNISLSVKSALEHFEHEDGNTLKHSVANVVYLHHPLLIIDEAHNARTPLTFETIERLHPSCIVEYTATPQTKGRERSNVLWSVSAATLKAEDIIKMPIELFTSGEWQAVVSDAVKKQEELEAIATNEEKTSEEYIRPIVLIQAEAESKQKSTIGVYEVKRFLLETCRIPEDQVAVATGEVRELEDVNLLERDCKIRFIITKQALKEGWDCPFAYIFCSVAIVRSSKDVEQLLGRVLRMPYVKKKAKDELNHAYAFVYSQSFYETANNLTDSLVNSGFTPSEAEQLLEIKKRQEELGGTFFGTLRRRVSEIPEMQKIARELREKIEFDKSDSSIIVKEALTVDETEQLKSAFTSSEDKTVIEQLYKLSNRIEMHFISPAKRGEIIAVPQLLLEYDGELRVLDEEILLPAKWSLAECNAVLTEIEFPLKVETGTLGLIDVDYRGQPFVHPPKQIQEELTSIMVSSTMKKPELIHWLVKETRHSSIPHSQSIVFISKLLNNLIEKRNLTVDHLVFKRFRLRDAVQAKIKTHFENAKKLGFQTLLFSDKVKEGKGKLSVGEDFVFPKDYPVNNTYLGKFKYQKHYYELIGDMNNEEAECAFNIDNNSKVEFWIRNLDRQDGYSFWLQTSTDKFYPDFVVKLKNGCMLVIEYKAEKSYSDDDSKEKRTIGQEWEAASEGRCLFLMTKGKDWKALEKKLST